MEYPCKECTIVGSPKDCNRKEAVHGEPGFWMNGRSLMPSMKDTRKSR